MNTFPYNLAALRKQAGLSQQELARALRISRSALALYETGRREPDLELLCRMALHLDVSVDRLLGHRPNQQP